MSRWADVEAATEDVGDFAARVRRLFDAGRHKTLATLRKDGSPRISGIEAQFDEGELWIGMMPGSMKALDVLRDPRLALHSSTVDADPENPTSWPGDAKIAGRGIEVTEGENPEEGHRFRVEITEVVLTKVGDPPDHLVIETWHQGRGFERRERR